MKLIVIYVAVTSPMVIFNFCSWMFDLSPKCETGQYPPQHPALDWATVNLDLKPEDRWKETVTARKDGIQNLLLKMRHFLKELAFNSSIPVELIDKLIPFLGRHLQSPFKEEIEGVAKHAEIQYGEAVLYNLFYDLNPLCTSIVAQTKNGTIYHARNLDYGLMKVGSKTMDFSAEIRKTIINVKFLQNNQVLFNSTQTAGYVGILTALKRGKFTFSVNARHPKGDDYRRYLEILEWILGIKPVHWNVPFTRKLLEHADNFTSAMQLLRTEQLISPVYFILGGTKRGEGCIVAKGTNFENTTCISNFTDNSVDKWFVLETNYDAWKANPESDHRRQVGESCMRKYGQSDLSLATLYNVLSSKPVLAPDTTYTTLIQVEGHYETYIRSP